MSEKNIGVIVGIFVGLFLVAVIYKIANKNGKIKTEYDERQEVIRGVGYKYAFWAYTAIMGILVVGDMLFQIDLPIYIIAFASLLIAGLVLSLYCIAKDAYWGMNNNKKRYITVFIIAGVINFASAIVAIINNEMIIDGVIQTPAINLLCGIMLAVIGVAIAVADIKDEKED